MAVDSNSALFVDPVTTETGEPRATVKMTGLETLWFNTGTLCNIACDNCYIESSPENDRLEYLSLNDVAGYLDEIEAKGLGTTEVGFTGGEPFMNPDILAILRLALSAGYSVLVLTNAMRPMMRPRIQAGLLDLKREFSGQLTLRVSIDHFDATQHEEERGSDTWAPMIKGLKWLHQNQFTFHLAGRTR
jgi:MoaA/NifB/PqqE/SkfB family radical SAM enzyme